MKCHYNQYFCSCSIVVVVVVVVMSLDTRKEHVNVATILATANSQNLYCISFNSHRVLIEQLLSGALKMQERKIQTKYSTAGEISSRSHGFSPGPIVFTVAALFHPSFFSPAFYIDPTY